jgi:hypothetical protein
LRSVGDGSGGAIIAWMDYTSGTSFDIYAQRTFSNLPPTITRITPNISSNTAALDVALSGMNICPGAIVTLFRAGESDIPGTNVSVANSTGLACKFNLTNKKASQWNIMVTNADGQSGILSDGFKIGSTQNDLSNAKAYPNPFDPDRCLSMTFSDLTAQAQIKIYTISGELVRELDDTNGTGLVCWDGKNTNGSDVASGIYIASINGNGTKKLKIAVQR